MEEKKVVGYAIKWVHARHKQEYWCDERGGGWYNKVKRHVFPTSATAVHALMSTCNKDSIGGFKPEQDSYKLIRITRRVKPKKYYVEVGPFTSEAEAKMCVVYKSNFQNPFNSKIVARNV